jgi:hypothetical protein
LESIKIYKEKKYEITEIKKAIKGDKGAFTNILKNNCEFIDSY